MTDAEKGPKNEIGSPKNDKNGQFVHLAYIASDGTRP
jgi:hypothetical protein